MADTVTQAAENTVAVAETAAVDAVKSTETKTENVITGATASVTKDAETGVAYAKSHIVTTVKVTEGVVISNFHRYAFGYPAKVAFWFGKVFNQIGNKLATMALDPATIKTTTK